MSTRVAQIKPDDTYAPDGEHVSSDAKVEAAARNRLSNLSVQEIIRIGHEEALRGLVAKAMAGTITHQELAILRNMLRDNGMTLGVPPVAPDERETPDDLPDLPNPNYND